MLIVIAIIYVGFAYYYESVIFPRTKINGIDCSELSVEQAERMIKEKVEDYALELTFRDDSENVIDGKEIDYEYVSKGDVQKILDEQNPWEWIVYIFKNKEYHFEESIQYDAAKLLNKFYNLNNINGDTQISPENACVV